MSNSSLFDNAAGRLAAQSDAIVAAFEAKDPDAFRWILTRLEILPRCELICEWLQIKLCVLRCVEVCGPPREDQPQPSLAEFARVVVHLASDEKLLRRVV